MTAIEGEKSARSGRYIPAAQTGKCNYRLTKSASPSSLLVTKIEEIQPNFILNLSFEKGFEAMGEPDDDLPLWLDTSENSKEDAEKIQRWKEQWPTLQEVKARDQKREESRLAKKGKHRKSNKLDESLDLNDANRDKPDPEDLEREQLERERLEQDAKEERRRREEERLEQQRREQERLEREREEERQEQLERARVAAEARADFAERLEAFENILIEARYTVPDQWASREILAAAFQKLDADLGKSVLPDSTVLADLERRFALLKDGVACISDLMTSEMSGLAMWAASRRESDVNDAVTAMQEALVVACSDTKPLPVAIKRLTHLRDQISDIEDIQSHFREELATLELRYRTAKQALKGKKLLDWWATDYTSCRGVLRPMLSRPDKYDKRKVASQIQQLGSVVMSMEDVSKEALAKKASDEKRRTAELDAEKYETFVFDNPTTWNVQRPVRVASGVKMAMVKVTPTDENYFQRIGAGELADSGSPVTGMAYHCHMIDGSGGISYAYDHLGGNRVQPVIFDYATKRQNNKYEWKLDGKTKSSAAPLPSDVKARRPPS